MPDFYKKTFEVIKTSLTFHRNADHSVSLSLNDTERGFKIYEFTPDEWREVERALQIAK